MQDFDRSQATLSDQNFDDSGRETWVAEVVRLQLDNVVRPEFLRILL
jgi:hypothetical protein